MASGSDLPHIVILGAGFGGLFATQAMARLEARITLIDRHNYHLFQPLLYQVATAGLPPSDISWPIRSILRQQRNVSVVMDEVLGVETSQQRVVLRGGPVDYDFLIIATGARHSYFGHNDWSHFAPGLKSIDDATLIRRRILHAFEQAEMLPRHDSQAQARERLLHFVVVGGGPTGVELAGTIAELARFTLARDFRRIDPRSARIVLIEAADRILPGFEVSSSGYAQAALQRLGVEVLTRTRVSGCSVDGVELETPDGQRLSTDAATVIWAAGVEASPVGRWLGIATTAGGRIAVNGDLSIPGHDTIFVIGDAALVKDQHGSPVPGIAPAAKQQGRYVARILKARLHHRPAIAPFNYRHQGNLATIGRGAAIIEYRGLRLRGRLAWWVWGAAHIYFLLGVRSPLLITIRWLWEYLSYSRGARLITGTTGPPENKPGS